MTLCCLLGNNVDCVFHFTGWQLIRLLQVFESVATVGFYHCVLGKSFVVVSVALAPFAVCFAVWQGDLRLAFCFWWFLFWFL